jgi:aminoglycoside 3-N-acetyltransferase
VKPLRARNERKRRQSMAIRFRNIKISGNELIEAIDKIQLDCDVFLHSSISSIGHVNCSTKFITDFLLKKVDISKNTLLATAMPFNGMRTRDYLRNNPVFDVRNAPIETGAINRALASQPAAERSLHPTHSVIAIGPKSYYYVSDHHLDIIPFGIHSPYYKLIENNAKILLIGAELKHFTFVHVIEDVLGEFYPVNPYLKKVFPVKAINVSGENIVVWTRCHNPLKRIGHDTYNFLPYYKKYNAIETHIIGASAISVLDVKKCMYAEYMALLDGISAYGKFHLKKRTRDKINEQISLLES